MTHSLLGRLMSARTKVNKLEQPFKYLLVLDFESTCDKHGKMSPQEIIEFPCLALSTEDWQVKNAFHHYIKPRINPIITPFCTDLTGIMQEHVDHQPGFVEIFTKFQQWLTDEGFVNDKNTSAFMTCGDWDLKIMLPDQCALENVKVPKYFEQWIDLKQSYCEAADFFPRSLKDMLIRSDIPHHGKLHSGLWDVQNMISIVTYLKEKHNAVFNITSYKKKPH